MQIRWQPGTPFLATLGALALAGVAVAFWPSDKIQSPRVSRAVPVAPMVQTPSGHLVGQNYDASRRVFKIGSKSHRSVMLSFDDGPFPLSCTSILNTLKEKKVVASFFVVGRQVDGNPDLVRQILADGHELANHTYDHLRLDKLPRYVIYDQIKRCDESVARATDRKMLFFRPPGMRFNDEVIDVMKSLDHTLVFWSLGAKDFIGTVPDYELTPELRKLEKITPALVVERVRKQLKPGTIILLHDNMITAQALPAMIDAIRAEGYAIESCASMMSKIPERVIVVSNPPCTIEN